MGSDSQAVIDLFEETRRIELYQRLATGERGTFGAEALGTAMTWDGHASLGWPEAGEIAPGSLADLVTVSLDSPRLAGLAELAGAGPAGQAAESSPDLTRLQAVIFAASSSDVRNVVIGGRDIVVDGQHTLVENVPAALAASLRAITHES